MTGFTLDDVRESFTGDLTRFLGQIEGAARTVVTMTAVVAKPDEHLRKPIENVSGGLHAIVGTTSLVGVESIAGACRRLEQMAVATSASIEQLGRHAAALRGMAAACLEGVAAMRTIMNLELANKPAEAGTRAKLFAARLDKLEQELGLRVETQATAPPSTVTAFQFGGEQRTEPARAVTVAPVAGPTVVAAGSVSDAPDDELEEVFRSEARSTLTALAGHVARLRDGGSDAEAVAQVARLLHLFKGAAASVGVTEAAALAKELHRRVERHAEEGLPVDAALVFQLTDGLERLRAASLPGRGAMPPASIQSDDRGSVADADADEPRSIFLGEARDTVAEAEALQPRLAEGGAAQQGALRRLERLFHRLKGSALVVGDGAVAAIAARGQNASATGGSREALGEILAELAATLGLRPQTPPPTPRTEREAPAVRLVGVAITVMPTAEGELWEAFVEESGELLDAFERHLTTLERSPQPRSVLAEMLRTLHTLKGAVNTVGLSPIGEELHAVESFVERLSGARVLPPLSNVVTLFSELLGRARRNIARAPKGTVESALASLDATFEQVFRDAVSTRREAPSAGTSWLATRDPAWSSTHDSSVVGRDPSSHGHARDQGTAPSAGGAGTGVGSGDAGERRYVRVAADRLDGLMDLVGELVVNRSRLAARVERLRSLHADDDGHRRHIIDVVDGFAVQHQFANLDGARRAQARGSRRAAGTGGPRASAGGFGVLELDSYEEIHVLSRRLAEASSDVGETAKEIYGELEALVTDADAITSVIAGLQSEVTRARMVPVETVFSRLLLPTRDAAVRVGKQVDVATAGETVAIDKSIADAMYGPLLHLVRNAVVHGVESEAQRRAGGKPDTGTITLAARQESGQIVIEVRDDGGGVNTRALRDVGVARGLLPADTDELHPAVLELVFAPGVSTSPKLGDVAGRGVGCDVVRRAIERLNGTIHITSERGRGTTFTIRLPLSMSITRAVVVRAAERTLAIPMFFAERIVEPDESQVVDSFGLRRISVDGELIPVRRTAELFGEANVTQGGGRVLICTVGEERVGIEFDAVLAQEEIVIKNLGEVLEGHPLFSGMTLRGDGEVALILDVPGIAAALTEQRVPWAVPPPVVATVTTGPGAAEIDTAWVEAKPTTAAAPAAPALALRVLFVDDSLSVRKVAERALRSLGVDVDTAVDGQDALEKLRAATYSVVFTDLEMPRMHGHDLIREMRYVPAYRDIPVIVVSSRSGKKHVDHALAMGANEYLTKPFNAETLADVLARWTRGEAPAAP